MLRICRVAVWPLSPQKVEKIAETKVIFLSRRCYLSYGKCCNVEDQPPHSNESPALRPVSLLLALCRWKGGHPPPPARTSPEAADRRKSMGEFLVPSSIIEMRDLAKSVVEAAADII